MPWPSIWFLGSTRIYNTNGMSIGSGVYLQLTANCLKSIVFNGVGHVMPKFPLHLGESGPTPWPTQVFIPNSMSIGSANNSILSLYFTIRQDMSPKKLPLPMGYPCPHLIMVRRTDQVHNPNGISIGSAVFVGLMVNRQTHRQTMQHRQQQAGYLCTLSMRCGLINTLLFPPTSIKVHGRIYFTLFCC